MGAASSEAPMRLAARSTSSAPVTTRRTRRTLRHFSASLSSRQVFGTSGNSSRCTEPSRARIAREPRFLRRERQHRREPGHGAAEHLVEHGQAGLAGRRGIGVAVERVLAHVEIERRQIDGHERVQRGEDALVVELAIGLAHPAVELGEPMQHQPLDLRHRGRRRDPRRRKWPRLPSIQRIVLRSLR